MFKKKECKRCGKKINEDYDFCPFCGNPIGKSEEDFGMLGKNDFFNSMEGMKLPTGLNSIFNYLMKNLDKQFSQMKKENSELNNLNDINKSGISIDISSFGDGVPKIKVKTFGNQGTNKVEKIKEMPLRTLSKEDIKKFLKFPRKEPKTEMRRFADKIVYEIEMPGVKSIDNISILKLENSIEIKAISKDKSYAKIIPINLPIVKYSIEEDKLILELKA